MHVTGQLQRLYEPCNCADPAVLTPVSQTLATATATAEVCYGCVGLVDVLQREEFALVRVSHSTPLPPTSRDFLAHNLC